MIDFSYIFPKVIYAARTVAGPLQVVKSGHLLRVTVNKVTQSIYKPNLDSKKGYWSSYFDLDFEPKTALILGYGAGTADFLLKSKFPTIKVTGVEIDPVICGPVRQMLFPQLKSKVITMDGYQYIKQKNGLFDLIICDMFEGDVVDKRSVDPQFYRQITNHLEKDGLVIANRIFHKRKSREMVEHDLLLSERFLIKKKVKVDAPATTFNLMYYLRAKN